MTEDLYLGRIVAVGRTTEGRMCAMYRVSSRSFPNRQAIAGDAAVRIVPKPGHEGDVMKNPYIAYNCARVVGQTAILSNGSHTDPIAEKVASGMAVRDALIYSLAVMDYEKDDYDTPRIAAVVQSRTAEGWLGVVRKDGLDVRSFTLEPGECFYLSTYERNIPTRHNKDALKETQAEGLCTYLLGKGAFAHFLHPVTAVAALESDAGFTFALKDHNA